MKSESSNQKIKSQFFDQKTITMALFVIAGTFIYSVGVVWFLNLGQFFAGGVTGISQLLSHAIFGKITPYLGIFIAVINIPLFLIGFKHVSLKFAVLTLMSVGLQTVFVTLLQWLAELGLNPMSQIIADGGTLDNGTRLLLAIIGGFVSGFGNALCLRAGGSSGGMDVIANALLVKKNISFTKYSFIVDCCIIVCSALISVPTALFTIVRLIVSILTIDKFYRIYKYVKIQVVTEHAEEIREAILEKFYHGITIYTVIGGYTMKEKKVLEIFASHYEVPSYIHEIKKVDPSCFLTVSNLTRIEGNYVKKTII